MPFTPFHFGPALVVKGIAKGGFSLVAFAIAQILIDLESLYFLLKHTWPVHRFLHTYLGATVVILVTVGIMRVLLRSLSIKPSSSSIIWSSMFGGYSHIVLDSVMHSDIIPLYPVIKSNVLLGAVTLSTLHNFCIYSGVVGLLMLSWGVIKELKSA